MTVSSELNRKEYAGDGLTTAFATSPVVFFDSADLKVYVVTTATGAATLQTITTHYTVSGGSGSTGTVTMLTAPTAAQTLVIVRDVAATQSSDFVNNDINDAETLEDALDRLTMLTQQNEAAISRSVRLADSDVTGVDLEIPAADIVDRASKFVGFDSSGDITLTAAGSVALATPADESVTPAKLAASEVGFWTDAVGGARIWKFRDRMFVGDAADHTGNLSQPYGETWLSENVATWPEKNAQMTVLSQNYRIGFLGGTHIPAGEAGGSSIGIAGFVYNNGASSTGRALYADVTHDGSATASYGLEIAVNNLGTDVQANAYSLTGGVIGIHMTPEGGTDYTLGDADSAATEATAPGTCAINIGAGSGGTANKKWNLGIRFASTSLTGSDGTTGTAIAIGMAKGHTIEWRASDAILAARIRSDVTAAANQDVGILFSGNTVNIVGTGEASIYQGIHVASGVNYLTFRNAIATSYPILRPAGSDTNIGLFIDTKGTGIHRFRTNDGAQEQFRVNHATNAVNNLQVSGAATGSPPVLAAIGSDTNIDLAVTPKGTGLLRYQVAAAAASVAANFTADSYIPIKDSAGTTYYIPIRTSTW
jgi:hypothetical protein